MKPLQSDPKGERELNFYKHLFQSKSDDLNEDDLELKNLNMLAEFHGCYKLDQLVYIKIDDMLLDSNGFTTISDAIEKLDEWEQRQEHLVPEMYRTETWTEESNTIPKYFFNNSFCNTKKVKQDIEKFLSHPIVQRILKYK